MSNCERQSFCLTHEELSRFVDKVRAREDDYDACWEWTAAKFWTGYGSFTVDGKRVLAHRTVLQHVLGYRLSPQTFVCHSCDNRACVNPNHLWEGDHRANMQDAREKGRFWARSGEAHWAILNPDKRLRGDSHWSRKKPDRVARGSRHWRAKLDELLVREIRQRISSGASGRSLADEFGVSAATVSLIRSRKIWAHVP